MITRDELENLRQLCVLLPIDQELEITQKQMAEQLGWTINRLQVMLTAMQYVGGLEHATEFLAARGTRSTWRRIREPEWFVQAFSANAVRLTESWSRKANKEMGGHARKSPKFQPKRVAEPMAAKRAPAPSRATQSARDAQEIVERARKFTEHMDQLTKAADQIRHMNIRVTVNIEFESDADVYEMQAACKLLPMLDTEMQREVKRPSAIPTGLAAATKYARQIARDI